MSKNTLITGCCGYIGSHTCVELLEKGYNVVGIDNFSNSKKEVLDKIEMLSKKKVKFYEGDVLDYSFLKRIFYENRIDAVIDFAAYKSVGDSVKKPIDYYINNVSSLLNVVKTMQEFDVRALIFSSTAAVYGDSKAMPLKETDEIGNTTNPYATSKLFCEKILRDLFSANKSWNIIIFRYFNPVGAHESGILKEEPNGMPSNLMPCILNVAEGVADSITVYGDTYNTKDGTGVRDYIHVVDLARAHIKGIERLLHRENGFDVYNLGTGTGYSVLEMIQTFEKINGIKIKYEIGDKRAGDIDLCYASALKAEKELDWKAEKGLKDMCKDAYNSIKKNIGK